MTAKDDKAGDKGNDKGINKGLTTSADLTPST